MKTAKKADPAVRDPLSFPSNPSDPKPPAPARIGQNGRYPQQAPPTALTTQDPSLATQEEDLPVPSLDKVTKWATSIFAANPYFRPDAPLATTDDEVWKQYISMTEAFTKDFAQPFQGVMTLAGQMTTVVYPYLSYVRSFLSKKGDNYNSVQAARERLKKEGKTILYWNEWVSQLKGILYEDSERSLRRKLAQFDQREEDDVQNQEFHVGGGGEIETPGGQATAENGQAVKGTVHRPSPRPQTKQAKPNVSETKVLKDAAKLLGEARRAYETGDTKKLHQVMAEAAQRMDADRVDDIIQGHVIEPEPEYKIAIAKAIELLTAELPPYKEVRQIVKELSGCLSKTTLRKIVAEDWSLNCVKQEAKELDLKVKTGGLPGGGEGVFVSSKTKSKPYPYASKVISTPEFALQQMEKYKLDLQGKH